MRTIVLLLWLGFSVSAIAGGIYGGGIGVPSDPYLISTPAHLNEIAANQDDWVRVFELTCDIDMTGQSFAAIGSMYAPNNPGFTGTFDGGDHVISNLPNSMFHYINGGTVKNLGLMNVLPVLSGGMVGYMNGGTLENCWCIVKIDAASHDTGGLAGNVIQATITGCWSSGTITCLPNSQRVGGLIGHLQLGTLTNCSSSCVITGGNQSQSIGGLIGRVKNSTVTNSYSSGAVSGPWIVGGLIGEIYTENLHISTISHCMSTSPVSVTEGVYSKGYGGGFAGSINGTGTTVTDCRSEGDITACNNSTSIGGLAGYFASGYLSQCSSDSSITAVSQCSNFGGLVGYLVMATIDQSFSTGAVEGGMACNYFGGLVGFHSDGGKVCNCYSLSPVSAYAYVGGLCGYVGNDINATIEKSFSAGQVTGVYDHIGGLVGYKASASLVSSSFWDNQTSTQTTSAAGKGKSTADMMNPATFIGAGWDFAGESDNGTDDFWEMNSYPGLTWQPCLAIDGVLHAEMTSGQHGQISFSVHSTKNQSISWTVSGYESCGWISSVSPTSGTSTDPTNAVTITVNMDADGLAYCDYMCPLILTATNGDSITVPITLSVFDRVDLADLVELAMYWGTGECDWGQPCKSVDWFVDGQIDIDDLVQFSKGWLGREIETEYPLIEDGFESGDFTHFDWQVSGNLNWQVNSTSVYQGALSARTGAITDSQTTTLEVTLDLTGYAVDTISFACRVSSESGYDYLRFYIDGQQAESWTGEANWSVKNYSITSGVHTFRWTYSKDSDGASGQDCAWIDQIRVYKM